MSQKLHPLIDILQDARRASGISQAKLAEKTGMQRNTIANYESGDNVPNLYKFTRWADALDLQIVIIRKKP